MDATDGERKFDGTANGCWGWWEGSGRSKMYECRDVNGYANGGDVLQSFKGHVPWLSPKQDGEGLTAVPEPSDQKEFGLREIGAVGDAKKDEEAWGWGWCIDRVVGELRYEWRRERFWDSTHKVFPDCSVYSKLAQTVAAAVWLGRAMDTPAKWYRKARALHIFTTRLPSDTD